MLAFRPRTRLPAMPVDGAWAAPAHDWAIEIEEQVMVLDPAGWTLVTDLQDTLSTLPRGLAGQVAAQPDGCTVVLRTQTQPTVAAAIAELGSLRGRLTAQLGRVGRRAAVAGSHPSADWREHGRGEPTFALHVHVAIPDALRAALARDRLRAHLPLLLALSANSPFLQGHETGLASVRGGAVTDPDTGLALDPQRGTLELGTMDAQTRVADVASLAALAQCAVRLEATRPLKRNERRGSAGHLEEAHRRAATDGMRALLHDARRGTERPAQDLATELIDACAPHAVALGCLDELERARSLALRPGATVQRARAGLRPGERAGGRRLRRLTGELSAAFVDA